MQNGPAENITTPDKPKEHHSLGTKALDTIKPHHKHKHKKKEAKKEGTEASVVVGTVVNTESKKKHRHHHHKTHEIKDKKHHHHHHHRQQESVTQPQQDSDIASIALKPQTPSPSLTPLALSTVSA
jgi:hypothetical protein